MEHKLEKAKDHSNATNRELSVTPVIETPHATIRNDVSSLAALVAPHDIVQLLIGTPFSSWHWSNALNGSAHSPAIAVQFDEHDDTAAQTWSFAPSHLPPLATNASLKQSTQELPDKKSMLI
jgi:hypothetical protein